MKKNLLLFMVTGIFSNCNLLESDTSVNTQNILFEVEYINYAWGFNWSGFYINKYGEVYSYIVDRDSIPRISENGYYSEQELMNKYRQNSKLVKNLDYREVSDQKSLIPLTASASNSDTLNGGADMGISKFKCYSYDWKKRKYQEIILLQEGDRTFKNLSPAADSLARWLKEIRGYDKRD